MEKRTKIIIGVIAGIVLIGGGAIAYSVSKKKKKKAEMQDNLDDDSGVTTTSDDDSGVTTTSKARAETSPPSSTAGASAVPSMDKKETIATWKGDKARIKQICGRRRIIGKKKKEWLACVAREGGNTSDDFYNFAGNYMEVDLQLTDLG